MWSIFFTILFTYLLVRFIFGFVLPVSRAYLKMKKKMKEMNGFNPTSNVREEPRTPGSFSKANTASKSDYIDFEEVK